jgi:hypothetical protein
VEYFLHCPVGATVATVVVVVVVVVVVGGVVVVSAVAAVVALFRAASAPAPLVLIVLSVVVGGACCVGRRPYRYTYITHVFIFIIDIHATTRAKNKEMGKRNPPTKKKKPCERWCSHTHTPTHAHQHVDVETFSRHPQKKKRAANAQNLFRLDLCI